MKGNWSAYVGIPAWILLVNLLNLRLYHHDWPIYWITSGLMVIYIFLFWHAGLWWVKRIQAQLPAISQTRQRMLLTFGGYLVGVLGVQVLLLFGLEWAGLLTWTRSGWVYAGQALVGVLAVGITGAIYEFNYYFGQYRQAVDDAKAAQKALFASQLETLRQQVNPHFLFNSLNILDSLIEEDPQQARLFLEELSTVYRYLLRSNDQPLTDLNAELAFINSYYHLLKTRHGTGLSLVTAVDERYGLHQIPPLTLQLLVENAVKHNVVLPDQPLFILIRTDHSAQLQVSNNIQSKLKRAGQRPVSSNGVGLSNILAKYQLLGYPTPTVEEVYGKFVVTLPLVQPDSENPG